MKKLILLLVVFFVLKTNANPLLIEINQEWLHQSDVNLRAINLNPHSETEAIQLHLKLVEQTLRVRDVSHLSPQQKLNRTNCLNILNKYWKTEVFPQNEEFSYRTPIFIDKYNTFCAVGHLMKESGFEKVAREISRENNLVFVRNISNNKAVDWMNWAGLTMEECAWIQPGYSPMTSFKNCGKGVNGTITKLHSLGSELLVLGDFTRLDSSINSMGIAKWRKLGALYFWEDYSQGIDVEIINGSFRARSQFNAAAEYNGTLWLGGERSLQSSNNSPYHLYRRVNSSWQLDSSLRGVVHDLEIYNNDLYACGNFKDSSGNYFMAKYDASLDTWNLLFPTFTINPMYDMEVYNGSLIIGGGFNISYLNCYNVFSFDGITISPMYTGVRNTVRTIEVHQGKLYVAGEMRGSNDVYNMKYWNGSVWLDTNTFNLNIPYNNYIACLKSFDSVLYFGGFFSYYPLIGTYARNLMTTGPRNGWGVMDSTVNDIEIFDGRLYVGGAFTKTNGFGRPDVNHITYIESAPTSYSEIEHNADVSLYPNPTKSSVSIKSDMEFSQYFLFDISGKLLANDKMIGDKINLHEWSRGVYIIQLEDIKGNQYLKQVIKK